MGPGQHAHLTVDRPQVLVRTAVDPLLFLKNTFPKRFLLDVIERLVDRELVRLRVFFQDCGFDLFAQPFDRFRACDFTLGVKSAFDSVPRNSIGNIQQLLAHMEQRHFSLWFSNLCAQLFLNSNHLARMAMGEFERFDEFRFR